MREPENDTSVALSLDIPFPHCPLHFVQFSSFPAAVLASFRAPCLCGDCATHTHMHRQTAGRPAEAERERERATASDAANCARHPSV